MKPGGLFKNFLVLIVTIILALFLAEFGTVLYLKITKRKSPVLYENFDEDKYPVCIFDSELGYRLKPLFSDSDIHVNSLGFRSFREFDTDNPVQKRILLLGDSMLFGLNVPQGAIFSEIINNELPGCIFINTGVLGYNTVQEYLVLKKCVDKFKPMLVMLFFCQSNDMWQNVRDDDFAPSAAIRGGILVFNPPHKIRKVYFYKKSKFYRLLDQELFLGRDHIYLRDKLDFGIHRENSYVWKVTREVLHQIGKISHMRNFKVVIIDVSDPSEIRNRWRVELRKQLLWKASIGEGFLYYDLDMYYPANWQELFFSNDSHWNKKGHRFIAEFIKKILADIGI